MRSFRRARKSRACSPPTSPANIAEAAAWSGGKALGTVQLDPDGAAAANMQPVYRFRAGSSGAHLPPPRALPNPLPTITPCMFSPGTHHNRGSGRGQRFGGVKPPLHPSVLTVSCAVTAEPLITGSYAAGLRLDTGQWARELNSRRCYQRVATGTSEPRKGQAPE
eukprot:COSAG05_NODE_1837_length_3986_cov_4.058657_4_plen_165_part_00